jgi:alpha-glucosidase (family GH31 glycosyl hydrolase)
VNVSTEDFLISVTKSPWHISIYEKSLGRLVLDESGEEKSRLGFGEWIGEYLHFYEGYLFRVGVVTKWNIAKEVTNYTISNDSATFILSTSDSKGVNMAVSLKSLQPKQLDIGISLVSSTHDSINANRVRMGFVTPNNEGFFGFGERFNDVNQRGHVVGSWLEDGSWGLGMFEPSKLKFRVPKGELSTYCPMPLMISTRGYGLQMNTFYRTTFDLAKSVDGVMILEQESDTFNLTLFSGETPQEIFQKQVEKNGHSLIPPPWAVSYPFSVPFPKNS